MAAKLISVESDTKIKMASSRKNGGEMRHFPYIPPARKLSTVDFAPFHFFFKDFPNLGLYASNAKCKLILAK